MKEKIVLRVGSQVDDLSMSALFGGVGATAGDCFVNVCTSKCACNGGVSSTVKCSRLLIQGFADTVSLNF